MRKFGTYLRTQFKRSVRHYPAILAFTLLLAVGVVLILSSLFQSDASEEDRLRVKLGLVGDLSNSYLDLGVMLVQNFDSSQYYLEFVVTDRENAVERLKARELLGFVEVPADFVDAMMYGRDSSVKYVAISGPAVLGSLLVEEVAATISEMVSESQNGLYGYIRYADKTDIDRATRSAKIEELNIDYVERIFMRDKTYEVEVIGQGNNLSFQSYYVCAFCMLMVLLMGTVCVNLLTKSDLSLSRLLTFRRFGSTGQILAEYLPFLAIIGVNLLLFFAAAGVAVGVFDLELSFLQTLEGFGDYLLLGLAMLPSAVLLTALQFFLYELTTGIVSAVLLQILATLALAFASGYLLPLNSMPPVLAAASAYLPTGLAFSYAASLLTDSFAVGTLASVLAYAAVILAAAVAVRTVKIRSSRV
ncbi:MAG: ABC transporter permease [Ruminococcaceae bacterium]|nr:ABC transporter permease [Oscillospiraceae bacterium]